MRILSISLVLAIIFAACQNQDKNAPGSERLADKKVADAPDTSQYTTVEWLDSLKNFGEVKEGNKVDIQFRFKNTGDKPLMIQSVVPGCGCTVPEYTNEPVMPGKEGFVKAVFNSENQHETVHKTVNVAMNTKPGTSHTLVFEGKVIKKK